jgi:hypothetical protein
MARANSYPGETDPKRLARLAVYRRVEELQPQSARSGRSFVVLAGPRAGELGCLRHFLKTDPTLTHFVDRERVTGLARAKEEWPGVNTHNKNAYDVIGALETPAALVHMDVCGYLDRVDEQEIRKIGRVVCDWGMVFFTFYRGRERPGTYVRKRIEASPAETPEGKRFQSTAQAMTSALGSNFHPVFSLRYTGVERFIGKVHLGPMGVLGFQKIPPPTSISAHWFSMLRNPSPYGGYVPTDPRLLREHLRVEALSLRTRGLNASEVAAILHMNPGTVAAWFAKQSR